MRRRLVLHIGDHKTATTAIQDFLARGGGGEAISYPTIRGAGHHNILARALRNRAFTEEAPVLFKALAREVDRSRASCIILSGEEFERVPPETVREVFHRFLPDLAEEMEVVAYIRPHPGRITATYAERIKQGFTTVSFDRFLHRQTGKDTFHYAPRLERQRAVWGERLVLRPMSGAHLHNGSVVEDLLAYAVPGGAFDRGRIPTANPTLSVRDLAVMRCLQDKLNAVLPPDRSFAEKESRRAVGWRFARLMGHYGPGGPAFRPSRAQAERIREAYGEDAARVDRLLSTGALFADALDTAVDTAPAVVAGPDRLEAHFAPDVCRVIEIQADFIAQMFARDPGGWAEDFRRRPLVLSDTRP